MYPEVIGVLWPNAENYARFAEVCDDEIEDSHAAFVAKAGPKIDHAIASGQVVKRLEFDPDELARWCRANGRKVDAHGRMGYAATLADQNSSGAPE